MYNYGASGSQTYQGYPYVNPPVVDAPSIDAATAARWANLPRKPMTTKHTEISRQPEIRPDRVYIDIPGTSQSTVSEANTSYVRPKPASEKGDPDDSPRVYIELPLSSGSDVADRRIVEDDNESFVQETIFYDPFKDRRIEVDRSDSEGSSAHSSIRSTDRNRPNLDSTRPTPPNTLNLGSPSRGPYPSSPHNLESLSTKEATVYGNYQPDDGFHLAQIPVREFPEPPPAYTEIDHTSSQGNREVTLSLQELTSPPTDATPDLPRTQVIIPNDTQDNEDTKLFCSNCGIRSHSLIIRQNGFVTHVIAILFLFMGLIPLTLLVYCTSCCKYKNYFCRYCNRLIAYEVPILCQQLTFVSK